MPVAIAEGVDSLVDVVSCVNEVVEVAMLLEMSVSVGGVMGVATVGNCSPCGHLSQTSSLGSKLCKTDEVKL